ncbi:MAG: tRNA (guanosine(37)-N1)-methyltransferase TrmD [Magnetococcales bacterium]|nr:tRNA (guanosine(37)-N1)-methyltransferase TrmD [Magnetococcales bacterium]
MRFSILTLFPDLFRGPLEVSILQRARQRGLLEVVTRDIRAHAPGRHRQVDDAPFGGGPGMVLRTDVLDQALAAVLAEAPGHVVLLSPQGSPFRQADAWRLAVLPHVVLICGHYEGIDERFVATRVDEELSLGDFVLTGGEIPALAVIDAVTRLLPGVLGDAMSAQAESFQGGVLDHPHYTRPAEWAGIPVPPVLRSGDHGAVADWRRRQALLRTLIRRPDLLNGARWNKHEQRLLAALTRDLDAMAAEDPGRHDRTSGAWPE